MGIAGLLGLWHLPSAKIPSGGQNLFLNSVFALHGHVPRPRTTLDRSRIKPVKIQLLADFFEHPRLLPCNLAIGGGYIA